MDQSLVPWIAAAAGLVGAVIGSLSSIAVIWIQGRTEWRRERWRTAVQLAMHEYDGDMDRAKSLAAAGHKVGVMPISTYVDFHARIIELLSRGHAVPEDVRDAYRRNLEIVEAVRAASKERRARRKRKPRHERGELGERSIPSG